MNEDPTQRPPALDELDTLHVAPAPVRDLIAAGHTARRRRRTVISSVLAAAVIVAGVSVATAHSSPRPDRPADVADSSEAPESKPFPDPPTGTKWVGMKGVVVAVPTQWPVLSSPCGDGSPGVVLDGTQSAVTDCMQFDAQVASVTLTPLDVVDAESVRPSGCTWSDPGSCFGSATFRDQGVGINVVVHGDEAQKQVDRILDSAMVLPDGWTTVPFGGEDLMSARAALLGDAGFKVVVPTGVPGQSDGPSTSTPESGGPVRQGATVTLQPVTREPEAQTLTVTVEHVDSDDDDAGRPTGSARWEADAKAVTYLTRTFYNQCVPEAGVEGGDGGATLILTPKPNTYCKASPDAALFTVSGLTEAPTELAVTEDGTTRAVPVEQAQNQEQILTVTLGEFDEGVWPGSAYWSPDTRTVSYKYGDGDGACLTGGRSASRRGESVVLTLAQRGPGVDCDPTPPGSVTFDIRGLDDAPARLVVETGTRSWTVPVEQQPEHASTAAAGTCFPGGCD